MDWCETKLDDKNKFEFSTSPERQEYDLEGECQDDGCWQCKVNYFPGGTVSVSMPVPGKEIASFVADSPEQAKQLAQEVISKHKE